MNVSFKLRLQSFNVQRVQNLFLEEQYDQGPEAGLAGCAACISHEIGPGSRLQPCYPARLVDTKRALRART